MKYGVAVTIVLNRYNEAEVIGKQKQRRKPKKPFQKIEYCITKRSKRG